MEKKRKKGRAGKRQTFQAMPLIGDIITSSRALCNNAGLQHAMVQKASL